MGQNGGTNAQQHQIPFHQTPTTQPENAIVVNLKMPIDTNDKIN